MTSKRKKHSAKFKFKVALEAAKNNKTRSQLATEYEVHPTQIIVTPIVKARKQ